MEYEGGGQVKLSDKYTFNWIRMNDGEIYGNVQRSDGSFHSGLSGYYRTDDVQKALRIARIELGLPKED